MEFGYYSVLWFGPMIITSRSEWTLWVGWDRGTKRTLGNMRQQLVLNTPKAVAAFAKIFGK